MCSSVYLLPNDPIHMKEESLGWKLRATRVKLPPTAERAFMRNGGKTNDKFTKVTQGKSCY